MTPGPERRDLSLLSGFDIEIRIFFGKTKRILNLTQLFNFKTQVAAGGSGGHTRVCAFLP